ncbi:MAG TPA: NRDE family protein [Thermoanaerobaculia bacterium]|nr:NRDE family protein [Thermoanaerobaculia bacterium]
MCLILFSWDEHPRYRLVVAANRDELHSRATLPAHAWDDGSGLIAGRDLQAGGTWMGVTPDGRFAAVTNYHHSPAPETGSRSRGALVADALRLGETNAEMLRRLEPEKQDYGGFSLLSFDGATLAWTSNRVAESRFLDPAVYGLANRNIDDGEPKVVRGKGELVRRLEDSGGEETPAPSLLELLSDSTATIMDPRDERERRLSSIFINDPVYGTRASTVFLLRRDGRGLYVEQGFDSSGARLEQRRFEVGS